MVKNSFCDNPIFIGGHRRSGTTLFISLLDNHPQLATFPVDSGFFYAYFPQYEDPKYSNEDRIKRVVEFCYRNFEEQVEKLDPVKKCSFPFDRLYNSFEMKASSGTFTSKEMLAAMLAAFQEVSGDNGSVSNKRWAEKTTSSEIYAKYIFDWFPGAQFIHIIRDPKDNYASLKSGWSVRYKHRNDDSRYMLQSMVDRGKLGMELAKYNARRYGENSYLIIRYEDLVADTKATMKKICDFLKIEYKDCLLEPTVLGMPWKGNNFRGDQFDKPSVTNVNRWKDRISEHEARVIEYYFYDLMHDFGYKPSFKIEECIDSAVEHYKWYNYSKVYSG